MATTEPTINDALAGVLRSTRRAWKQGAIVRSENTGMLKDSGARPDILIAESTVSPVTIETEVIPAVSVEKEACSRLGCELKANGRMILSSIAVRLPKRMRSHQDESLRAELESASDLEFCLYTGLDSKDALRHPLKGWILGSVRDLSVLAQAASVPPEVVEKAANHLVEGVSHAAAIMQEMNLTNPAALKKISAELKQDAGEQTLRMAATMLLNALVFQESLANGPGELSTVKSLDEIRTASGEFRKSDVLAEWAKILAVNYWPIFDISRRILQVIPSTTTKVLFERLAKTSEELLQSRLMRSHDLTGAVFQRVIADRKFLAAYYTTPSSAALLLGLAITETRPLRENEWADPSKVTSLRIADFSCGTGTLLSTAYQKIGQIHELAGGDSQAIHPEMMARALVGCDVLPAAAHLTASMLAGSHPAVNYTKSSILTVAYGVLANGTVATGSLDLLDPQKKMEEWAITAKVAGGQGESEENPWMTLPHQDFDLVVMNPPFVRATGHEAKKKGVPNPMFAAFSASEEDQRLMGKTLEQLAKGTSAHGNAGLASYFFVLADRKLRLGGVLALVMPLSLLSGEAWEQCRAVLSEKYSDIVVLSISGAKDDEMAFSADTGMGECLIVAHKTKTGTARAGEALAPASLRATFVVLRERPTSPLLGYSVARQILKIQATGTVRRLEDGPVGGTKIVFGDQLAGQAVSAPLPVGGTWNPTRVQDLSLAQAAFQIAAFGRVWLPGMSLDSAPEIAMKTIGDLAVLGPYHSDIDGITQKGEVRGPFEHVKVDSSSTSTYPILWSHEADRERSMRFEADSEGYIRTGAPPEKLNNVWESRSHCHFNQNFRFTSQSTAMQFTPRRSLGGRAWISIKAGSEDIEKAIVAWSNTSLGILLHWYHANKQQSGRGNVVTTSLVNLPVPDFATISQSKLSAATDVFDRFCDLQLLTIDAIDTDPIRRRLDEEFLTNVFGFPEALLAEDGPIDLLRKKLAQEPSISGRRKGESMGPKKKAGPRKQSLATVRSKSVAPQPSYPEKLETTASLF